MLVGMLPMVALPVSAATSGDYTYTVLGDGTAQITDYTGSATNLTIPSRLGGYTVTSIGNWAFGGCKSLESVIISYGVTSIGESAFNGCSFLESVTIPGSVKTIGNWAFNKCSLLNNVTIGNGVKTIGNGAFGSCGQLKSVTIPDSVTSIGWEAFAYCGLLTSVTFGSGLTTIDQKAFLRCEQLKSVTIPAGVTSIGNWAFGRCKSLKSVIISYGVTSIGESAFNDCTSLESVTISGSVKTIGNWAFYQCSLLNNVTIGNGVKTIGNGAFGNCEQLKSVTIPDSVISIGWEAFAYCDSLTSVTIGDSVTTIGQKAFYYCEQLKSVTIPDSVMTIEGSAFRPCNALSNVCYTGSSEQWNNISIGSYNEALTSATRHYNYTPLHITYESATVSYASQGQRTNAAITAKGTGLSYLWYVKYPGDTSYSKTTVTSSACGAKMYPSNSGTLVYCVVKDAGGNTARSKTFELRLKATITSESATAGYAKKGATASAKVNAVGDGLKYTWYYRNENSTNYSKSSVTSATYKATMSNAVKNRRVYCIVKDKYGNQVRSKTFILREAVSITTQPKSTAVYRGAIAKTTVKASGDGLTYAWYIKNAGQTKYSKSSVTKATYSTVMNSSAKNRRVLCIVRDKYGNKVQSNSVLLQMK